MRVFFVILFLYSQAQAGFQAGDRVFDNRNYLAGTVLQVLPKGAYKVKLDAMKKPQHYSSYYAEELGAQIKPCSVKFCIGDTFRYTLPVIGKNRVGEILEIFEGDHGLVVFGVKLQEENYVRFLNSSHLGWMIKN